ncbi:MAG TPA: hypothetical protein PLD20_05710 [Blastocatellia bacterium]|nr:hypothetical protein [Blastocatellia bacterium]HMX25684.1 hypothetical protein [Blastocatellia bacterium]HMZ17403.1 hypothetical protein [Blastocatellia bacterium]HNG29225.1 hypothetical protein [Blastocatellia bacterium]
MPINPELEWTKQQRLAAINDIARTALNQCLPGVPHPCAWEWLNAIQALCVQPTQWLNAQTTVFIEYGAKVGGEDAD